MALSWNCQGVGNLSTVNALKNLIRAEDPNLVFLIDTKMPVSWMENLNWKTGFKNGVFVIHIGIRGGLALLWKDSRSLSKNHIDILV